MKVRKLKEVIINDMKDTMPVNGISLEVGDIIKYVSGLFVVVRPATYTINSVDTLMITLDEQGNVATQAYVKLSFDIYDVLNFAEGVFGDEFLEQ